VRQLGDSIMTAIVVAPFAAGRRVSGFGTPARAGMRARGGAQNRIDQMRRRVLEENDDLTVFPAEGGLHGAEIETYNDHRMAMCFAILGLKIKGIRIKNPSCVKKTFPNFFQKLAGRAPSGLGAAFSTRAPAILCGVGTFC
jgi:3-phosphoshikimate 1-carboxyvinyltransferase